MLASRQHVLVAGHIQHDAATDKRWGDMSLYLRSDVEKLALATWKSAENLFLEKERRTIAILTQTYRATDVLLLQECRGAPTPRRALTAAGRDVARTPQTTTRHQQCEVLHGAARSTCKSSATMT